MRDKQTKDDALTPLQPQSLTRRSAALVRRGLADAVALQSSEAHYNSGRARQDKRATSAQSFIGDLAGAIVDYTKAIEITPRYSKAYNSRGVARFYKGDLDGAIVDFNKAIKFDPRFAQAYYNRGRTKHDKGDLDGAIVDFDKAIEIDSRYAKAYDSRGEAKQDKGDIRGAVADYNIAIEINPRYAHPRVQRAFKNLLRYRLQRDGRRPTGLLDH